MLNERKNCVCCNKLTDNKNIYGFICKECNDTRIKVFKELYNKKEKK